MAGIGEGTPNLERLVAEVVAKTMPAILKGFLTPSSFPGQSVPQDNTNTVVESDPVVLAPTVSRGERFFETQNETVLPQDLLDLTTKAFSRALSKEKWKELTASHPQIKGTESLLVAPTMEAGMKEDIKKRHGYTKSRAL